MQVAIAGFMGVGKSTIGRLLSSELSRPFIDTDEMVELTLGRSIVECFQAGDEAIFRDAEAAAVRNALRGRPSVIALGGGATMRDDTRALLLEKAVLVHLHVPWDEVREWISEYAATRPLLQGKSIQEIHELYLSRLAVYQQAHIEVTVPRSDPEDAARSILERLEVHHGPDRQPGTRRASPS
jgi:shikimate kinase